MKMLKQLSRFLKNRMPAVFNSSLETGDNGISGAYSDEWLEKMISTLPGTVTHRSGFIISLSTSSGQNCSDARHLLYLKCLLMKALFDAAVKLERAKNNGGIDPVSGESAREIAASVTGCSHPFEEEEWSIVTAFLRGHGLK